MTGTQIFHLGDVLSVTTGRLVSPRGMDGLYDILTWMTGDDLFTHQIPRAVDECREPLLAQHPPLARVHVPAALGEGSRERAQRVLARWLAGQAATYGAPLPPGGHAYVDPLAELRAMMPGKPVIAIVVPDKE